MSECTSDYAQKKEFPTRNTVSQQQQQHKGGFFHALQVFLFISSKLFFKSIFENQTLAQPQCHRTPGPHSHVTGKHFHCLFILFDIQ